MTITTALTMAVAAFTGVLCDHPEFALGLKCQRRPGESEVAYLQRETARLDGVMRAMMERFERSLERSKVRDKRLAALIRECEARESEALALRALAGGIADHPRCKLFVPPDLERERFLAETKAAREKAEERSKESDLRWAAQSLKNRELIEKARELTKRLNEEAANKPKK